MSSVDQLRPLLFSIAYRMLGSVSDAEDVVQEALARYSETADTVESPRGFLTTVVTRLAIDQLRSARVRRERYVGSWLPEPLLTTGDEPAQQAEIADSLSQAFLVLLESLSPVERAVFLLREVFDYSYDEIAAIVDRSPENCRQLAVRARRHVDERRPRFEADRRAREELADRFFSAASEGDLDGLEELLASDVVLYGDGGGKAPQIPAPLHGVARVAKVFTGWIRQGLRFDGRMERVEVNGMPGIVWYTASGEIVSTMTLDIADGQVQAIRSIINPDKLRHLGPVADVRAILRSVSDRR